MFPSSFAVNVWKSFGENHTNHGREKFFHTNKCKCMSLIVVIELPISEGNGHVFLCSV